MCLLRRIMYEIAAFCSMEMRKKNSSLPRVVSMIKINILVFPSILSTGQIMFTCYAPNFEKVGDILVSACPYVCMYVCTYVFMFEISS